MFSRFWCSTVPIINIEYICNNSLVLLKTVWFYTAGTVLPLKVCLYSLRLTG